MADEGRHQHNSHHDRHHFLVVAYGVQSHVNPGRVLARRLTRLGVDGSILATLSVPVAIHRRMFPSLDGAEETTDGVISYVPHSDGIDDGSMPKDAQDRERRRRASFESLSAVVNRLAARGQPVTCVMCTLVQPSVLDVAREHGVPLALYWIQPAISLAANYHYFHGYGELIASHATDPAYQVSLPGLSRPLRIRDFPSILVDTTGSDLAKAFNEVFQELFEYIDTWRPKVLVNTFDELEATVLKDMKRHLDVLAVGPMVGSSTEARLHLFKHDDVDEKRYMEWLGAQSDKSVVYVSFGSISKYTQQQMEEIVRGLRQCGRPYLLVVRKDGLEEGVDHDDHCLEVVQNQGMVVEWCNQLEVLSHPAVGCFLTHCGWNSTLEAIVSGVPIIGVPNMFDQPTNAYLVEDEWEIGTRGERNSEGVFTGTELARCIELVMGEYCAKATAIRERVKALQGIAQEAADVGGPAERNLRDFVKTIQARGTVNCVNNTV
ncbi:cyanidin 3-O-rutinoside 5-O-glucosyltransferase-like [Phragmites australis]|uniref:cyanidin 3-O-rutinoside 5-O-glucosyltransferase-like n=1 Tax=Phragmites australis TaxID=29695 RepID=UPI002D77FB8D|nr:cyanidin 3-O-rutinoside 5-O-glucosyltransferase-like [Phragmites australis]